MKKFTFKLENTENLFNSNDILFKNLYKTSRSSNFTAPIEDLFIDLSLNNNELSILGLIRLTENTYIVNKPEKSFITENIDINDEKYTVIKNDSNEKLLTLRYIENIGIHIFAGRPDLSHYSAYSPGVNFFNLEDFNNRLEKFREVVEFLINEIYEKSSTLPEENIEYKIISNVSTLTDRGTQALSRQGIDRLNKLGGDYHQIIFEKDRTKSCTSDKKKEIPESLKRMYKKLANQDG